MHAPFFLGNIDHLLLLNLVVEFWGCLETLPWIRAPLLPFVAQKQNIMECWWEGLASSAIPPPSTSDIAGQRNKKGSITFRAALGCVERLEDLPHRRHFRMDFVKQNQISLYTVVNTIGYELVPYKQIICSDANLAQILKLAWVHQIALSEQMAFTLPFYSCSLNISVWVTSD